MLHSDKGQAPDNLDGGALRVALVQSRFNEHITNGLVAACRQELLALGVPEAGVTHLVVPGALEIPQALHALATHGRFDALVALGCVIRGETYHFELVSNESARGITDVALRHALPVVNAVLTVENLEQAIARQVEKGRDAARVALEMAHVLRQMPALCATKVAASKPGAVKKAAAKKT